MGVAEAEEKVRSAFDMPELVDLWFWDGDLGHALGTVMGEEPDWLLEGGTLLEEDDQLHGVDNLIEGDVVYRARKARALDSSEDPRACKFDWELIDPFTGAIQAKAMKPPPPPEDDWA
jgi:hypothetical protein